MALPTGNPDSHTRLSCIHCGAHVLVQADMHHPGGVCAVCNSTELVPLADALRFHPLVHAAPQWATAFAR
jgi:hypothetical protein